MVCDKVEFSEGVVMGEREAGELLGEDLGGVCPFPYHSTQDAHHLLAHLGHTQPGGEEHLCYCCLR